MITGLKKNVFFLLGFIKHNYGFPCLPMTVEELKIRITKAFLKVYADIPQNVWQGADYRFDFARVSCGADIELYWVVTVLVETISYIVMFCHCTLHVICIVQHTILYVSSDCMYLQSCSKFFVNNKDYGVQHNRFLRIWYEYVSYSNHGLKTISYNSSNAWYYSVTTGKYRRGTSYMKDKYPISCFFP